MIEWRSAGDSPQTTASPLTPVSSPPPNMAAGPPRPICLVYQDEKGRIHMDPEAVAVLQLVNEPVGVVSVCGPSRQGKSFIVNQGIYHTHIFLLAVQLSSMLIYSKVEKVASKAFIYLSS